MNDRLVFFTPGHREPGGLARQSGLVAATLSERGWDVRVVTRAGTLRRFHAERSDNLAVLEVPGSSRRRLGAIAFLACAIPLGLIWGRQARALVAIQLMSTTTAAAVCSLILRRPFVAFATTSGRLSESTYLLGSRIPKLRRALVRRAAFVVAQTPESARELSALVPPDRIVVIPNPTSRVVAPPLTGSPHVLFTGRFSEEKDLFSLLEAWRSVAGERPEARLTLVGEGGEYRSVEEGLRVQVETDPVLSRSVSFPGWVSDLGPFFRASDVYVFPSVDEGMSNALLEACAWGRVVVASDIPPNRAVVGDDYPLLFEAGKPDQLARALSRALDDDGARRQAVRCLEQRLPDFSVDAVSQRIEDLIDAANRSRH